MPTKKNNDICTNIYNKSKKLYQHPIPHNTLVTKFNTSMDTLCDEKELSLLQKNVLEQQNPYSQLAREYRNLLAHTQTVWRLAVQRKVFLRKDATAGPYTTVELISILDNHTERWRSFKNKLEPSNRAENLAAGIQK